LQKIALGQQFLIAGRELADESGQAIPEPGRLDAGAGQGFPLHEAQQGLRDAEAGTFLVFHRR
jgi:hypothetical protein